MSPSVGAGFLSRRTLAVMIIPFMQKPHWAACSSMKAFWSLCGWATLPNPSRVVIFRFLTALTGKPQERTDLSSRITVHAPHWDRPQPNLGPFSSRSSRKTYSSGVLGSVSTTCDLPFTVSEIRAMASPLSRRTKNEDARSEPIAWICHQQGIPTLHYCSTGKIHPIASALVLFLAHPGNGRRLVQGTRDLDGVQQEASRAALSAIAKIIVQNIHFDIRAGRRDIPYRLRWQCLLQYVGTEEPDRKQGQVRESLRAPKCKPHKGGLGMSKVLIGLAVIFLAGCSQQQNVNSNAALEAKVGELEKTVDDLKPGLGEIMGVIQQHHAKLYYAGTKSNWPLADYELSEIQESLDDAMKFYPKFKEVPVPLTELIPTMTKASIAQVHAAIEQKNGKSFAQAFGALSTSCSNCHEAANHPFVKIQAPTEAMFSNQKFTP
jgi:hypothetical protein